MQINFFGDFVASSVENISLSSDIKEILSQGDVNILNCEAVSIDVDNGRYKKILKSGPNIYQSKDVPEWLHNEGFTAVSLANNHIYDYGENAIEDTIGSFTKVKSFGAGTWDEAYKPFVTTVCGKSIAILALTHCEFGTLIDKWDKRIQRGAAWINHPCVDNIIQGIREEVDYLFVFAHAGVEHLNQPLPEWRDRYRSFIDMGCDGVIASHPHIIQGWEKYKGKPIVYSLGNFYFPLSKNVPWSWNKSIVASVLIDVEGNIEVKITPLMYSLGVICVDKTDEASLYLKKINDTLLDEDKYIKFIDDAALERMEMFYTMFQNGGMARCYTLKKIIRVIISYIQGKIHYNPSWLYNNIQSESHRWLFLRGLKNIYNLK